MVLELLVGVRGEDVTETSDEAAEAMSSDGMPEMLKAMPEPFLGVRREDATETNDDAAEATSSDGMPELIVGTSASPSQDQGPAASADIFPQFGQGRVSSVCHESPMK